MDKEIVLGLQHALGSPWADALFTWLSSKAWLALPLALGLAAYLIARHGRAGAKLLLAVATVIVVIDGLGGIVKLAVPQPRPCTDMTAQLRHSGPTTPPCGADGVPSNHALNFFALFGFGAVFLRSWRWGAGLAALAAAVAVSRVYLGLHYPSQVLSGALAGAVAGALGAWLTLSWSRSARQIQERIAQSRRGASR